MASFAKELIEHAEEEYSLFSWDSIEGIQVRDFSEGILKTGKLEQEVNGTNDPLIVLDWAGSTKEGVGLEDNSILFLLDYHHYMDKNIIVRKIRNMLPTFKATGKTLVIISHAVDLPPDIEKEVTPIQFKLPNVDELRVVLKGLTDAVKKKNLNPYPKNDLPILEAALGMTAYEAEGAFALSLREKRAFDVGVINREKAAVVKKTDMLEVVKVTKTLDDVGGLDNVKNWLLAREHNFTEKARKFGLRPPKGLLIGGLPGTGKSLVAKCTAAVLRRPLLRLDIGRIFGEYVGQSERNIRKCLDIADAVAPCVLWIDEFEKSFSSTKEGATNKGETSMRVYSTILTWMQEKTSDVFIVATANNVASIDEAFLRRLNCVFWVDLPDTKQRAEIISIHLKHINREPKNFDIENLSKICDKFSGSEIETWIAEEALNYAFSNDHELCDEDLIDTVKEIVPQAVMMAEDIQKYRTWAKEHKVKPASSHIEEVTITASVPQKRKISLSKDFPHGRAS